MDMYSYSPRGAKRSRSKTFSNEGEFNFRQPTPRLTPNSATTNSSQLSAWPTPPLSTSSSLSSGSSNGSFSSFPTSFSSLGWTSDHAGPPMVASPHFYTPPSISSVSNFDKISEYKPTPIARPTYLPQTSSSSVATTRPRAVRSSASFDPVGLGALCRDAVPPPAPVLNEVDFNPATDGLTPWEHQQYVEGLIGVSMLAIESIWPQPKDSAPSSPEPGLSTTSPSDADRVLPLRYFVKETLRRSRSSAAVLQTALYYLHRARSKIRARVSHAETAKERFTYLAKLRQKSTHQAAYPSPPPSPTTDDFTAAAAEVLATSRDPVICGRRMFLASLIAASKFLQDRTYSNRAWSRLSGLTVQEINTNERAFLDLLEFKLSVRMELYQNWTARLRKLQEQQGIASPSRRIDRRLIARTTSEYAPVSPTEEAQACNPNVAIPSIRSHFPSSFGQIGRSNSERELPVDRRFSMPSASPVYTQQEVLAHPELGINAVRPALRISTSMSRSGSARSVRKIPDSPYTCSPLRNSRRLSCDADTSFQCRPNPASRIPSFTREQMAF